MLNLARARKAYGAAVTAAAPLGAALGVDGLTLGEAGAVAGAAVVAFLVTYFLPNRADTVVKP